jgi:hypothetical protein
MDLFVAEVYDYSFEQPMFVGIYDSEDLADQAIEIVMRRYKERDPKCPDSRFVPMVNQVQLNGFCPAVMDNLGWGGM